MGQDGRQVSNLLFPIHCAPLISLEPNYQVTKVLNCLLREHFLMDLSHTQQEMYMTCSISNRGRLPRPAMNSLTQCSLSQGHISTSHPGWGMQGEMRKQKSSYLYLLCAVSKCGCYFYLAYLAKLLGFWYYFCYCKRWQ